jgi:hypothetical protein
VTRDPICEHARRGIVESGDPSGPHAATQVCVRPECIADAKRWATEITRLPAEHRPDLPAQLPLLPAP